MRKLLVMIALASLVGCGNDDAPPPATPLPTVAETSDIRFDGSEAGITPFISFVHLVGQRLPAIRSISYVVEPKPGSVSSPVRVTYTLKSLKRRGRLVTNRLLHVPVFGLYAGYANAVSIELSFGDGSTQTIACTLTTEPYTGHGGIYENPVFVKTREAGSDLGFDFFAIKSGLGSPVIVDTDGALRWAALGDQSSISSAFIDNGFVVGEQRSMLMHRIELDGTTVSAPLASPAYINFHHNIDRGRTGLLAEMDSLTDFESTISEFTISDGFTKEWNFATIVGDHMRNAGDDPSLFVRRDVDWFHSNAATYDPTDDSLLVSSRENFVISVDYDTGAINWILGDPTKYWWTFPSLRAKALTVSGSGLYPIGQHAVSMTSDGLLLLFNNGLQSGNQPVGAPLGANRAYSAVSAYRIDKATKTATEVWNFDYGRTILSSVCSSAYEAPGRSLLISYAWADTGTRARLVGLNSQRQVVFDFQYVNRGCSTSWNAMPIALENLNFT